VAGARHEHEPVLVDPVLAHLAPQPDDVVLDGTIGLGGHARAILPHILPDGRYIGLDLDAAVLTTARERLEPVGGTQVSLFHANYAEFPAVLAQLGVTAVDHLLLDLGVNSAQLDDPTRGFSFDREGPLDMRFDQEQREQALDLINGLPEADLADLFYYNAQEGASRKIARRICQARHHSRITTTRALAQVVESVASAGEMRVGKIHPATRVFQALRIAVNRELDNLRDFLAAVCAHLRPGGKLAVISFHSLEDGTVKDFLRQAKTDKTMRELTRRPVVADPAERKRNPRSRSAKLRVAERSGGA
jgi:16S rRNA (cytosine1402-N4)-methyltransferase